MYQPGSTVASALERFRRGRDAQDKMARRDLLLERGMWEAVADALEAYWSQRPDPFVSPEPFPHEIALMLGETVKLLISGYVPPSIETMVDRRPGAPRLHPQEQRDIEAAVRYLEAVKAGLIKDKSPTKTIEMAYGVPARTHQSWRKRCPVDLDSFFPGAVSRDKVIEREMLKAGERYKRASRRHGAINRRARTRN